MKPTQIHSFLVHPGKHEPNIPIRGTSVGQNAGKLYEMLAAIYTGAPQTCKFEIAFVSQTEGKQQNDVRDLLLDYLKKPSTENGRRIASRLQEVTTRRSGLGLLFLMSGKESRHHRLVISRFPADSGILAEEHQSRLDVEFVERVFMKSATAYKNVLYSDASLTAGFWTGRAEDRQLNNPLRELSKYWITDFLCSTLRTTGPAGTRRIAIALREATRAAKDLETKEELLAVTHLLRNQAQTTTSASGILNQFGLSETARDALSDCFENPALLGDEFVFDAEEFGKHVAYRSVELHTGAMLVAEDSEFDTLFVKEAVAGDAESVRYTTEGRETDKRLRKSKT